MPEEQPSVWQKSITHGILNQSSGRARFSQKARGVWEMAMQNSPKQVFYPDDLDLLSEVLNEVMSAVGPDDKTIGKKLAARLARLLIEQFTSGVTDREKLKSIIYRSATRSLH